MVFIDACLRQKTPYTPIWLMRQAGRYLDEYRYTRSKVKSFLELCKNVDLATEITLQPIEILDVDAAIIFSDILVIPYEMGLELEFRENFGPKFLQTITDFQSLSILQDKAYVRLEYVYDCIAKVRSQLSKDKALIGFSGAPWTLATYMIEGLGSKSYEKTKKILYSNPELLHTLLVKLSDEIKYYLCMQIKAGANAVMLFDSWANALEYNKYLEFGWQYLQDIARFLKTYFLFSERFFLRPFPPCIIIKTVIPLHVFAFSLSNSASISNCPFDSRGKRTVFTPSFSRNQ